MFFFHLPQIPNILSLAGTRVVYQGRMLVLSTFSVHFCKEQITKTELPGDENVENFAEIDSCYRCFHLPCF